MVRRFAGWLGRRSAWAFVIAWTALLLVLLIAVWVFISTTPDPYNLNLDLAFLAFFAAVGLWLVGLAVIAALAWLVRRFRPRPAAKVAGPAPQVVGQPDD